MATKTTKRHALYSKLAAEQRQWIEEHGGNLTGYVEHYGSKSEPDHYGSGGELIYEADHNALIDYERKAGIRT